MAGGYFNDGNINIELGAHVFASPTAFRRNVILAPADIQAEVLTSGGGALELEVTGQRVRSNLGDAERYIYEILRDLATSDPGNLGVEDNRDFNHVFSDSVCIAASGEVEAFQFADMRFTFLSPEKSSEPAWVANPLSPSSYVGTSTSQDYAAGGVTLGLGVRMRIEMMRTWELRELPRARGARTSSTHRNAQIRLIVESHLVADTVNLAQDLEDLARLIGPEPVTLTGNGNAYFSCVLESLRPMHTDLKATAFETEFVQEIGSGAGEATTTTTAGG